MGQEELKAVTLKVDGSLVHIERRVFAALFHNSVMSGRAAVRDALAGKPLAFETFVDLARRAEIPYPLFLALIDASEADVSSH